MKQIRFSKAVLIPLLSAIALPVCGALRFDGVNDYVTFGPAAGLGATNFTIECWFKRQGAGAATSTGNGGINSIPLVTKGRGENEAGVTNMNYFFGLNTNDVLAADFEDRIVGLNHPTTNTVAAISNSWQHAAVTYQRNGSNGTWVIYLNGAAIRTNTFNGTNISSSIPEGNSIQHAALGSALTTAGTAAGFFNGSLEEVRIWNHARNAQQIATNKDLRITSASGLIGRWPLTETSGTTADDTSGSGIDGTLLNGPVWTTDSFDTNVALTVTIASPANNATVNTNFTITAIASGGGAVTNVYFYDGNTLLGNDTSSPYSYTWNSSPPGAHALKAVARDNTGLAATSAVVNVTVTVSTAVTFTETFDSYADGTLLTDIGGGSAWGPAGIQYEVVGGGGVNGSAGLSTDISGSSIFNWKAHTFQWSTLANGTKVAMSLDFRSSPTGTFDDDRVGWTITPDANISTGSQLALQLDNTTEGGMVFYHNLTRTPVLDALSGIKNSTWYRFNVEFTKLSDTSASVVGTLTELDGAGNPTGTPYVGTIADTSTFSNPPSNTLFTATEQCPSFKNFNTEVGNADNATFTITPPTVAEYVIVISVDGMGSAYVPPLLTTGISNELTTFKRLQAEGAATLNARVDVDYAITLPCHVCMMTGRGVNGAAGHNWTGNGDPAPTDTIALNKGSYVASAFDVAHDNGLRTGIWASKSKFHLFQQSYSATSGALDTTGTDNGRDKIDYDNIVEGITPVALTDDFINQMTNNPFHFVFFHYAEPDTAGHSSGWSTDPSSAYATALKDVDTQIGRIIQMVENSPTLQGKTAIIVTTDHGGHGNTHGDLSNPLDYTIPFYVWGPGVTAGGDLYAMNTTSRTAPGTSNPPYTGGQPVRNGDAGNLALDMLRLGAVPGSTIDSAHDLVVNGISVPPTPGTNLIFGFANVWRYRQLTDLDATNWKLPAYDDSSWPSGPGVLAYETCGCLPEPIGTTLITNENSLTFYFRTHFNFSGNPASVSLLLSNLIDDGAVFYLNGVEIARVDMPAGTITYTTLASATIGNATNYTVLNISGDLLTNLVVGDNVLAVEVHQVNSTSTDIVFGSSLSAVGEGAPAGSGGLSFDGEDDMVTMGVASGLGVTNFTIECWFKQQGPGNRGFTGTGGIGANPLVTKGQGENEAGATNMNYFFGLSTNDSGQTVLGADFEDFNNGLNHPVRGNSVVVSGQWQHGAVTYNVATATWVLYLNGLQDTNLTISGVTNSLMALPRFDSLQHAALGACLRTGGTTNADSGFFDGVMDEVRIWNYTRSSGQILSNYNRQITDSPAGLIARWSLDDAAGTTATNSIAGGVNGTLVNGPIWTDGYPFPAGPVDQPPAAPIPNTPINGATGVSNSPVLSVTVSDPETNNVTVTFYGRVAGSTSGSDFTLVALPDTQYYVSSLNGGLPAMMTNQTHWIVTNRVSRNIQYVTQLGDCVEHGDNGGTNTEWLNATNALYKLENPLTTLLPEGLPYGVAVGNHDQTPIYDPNGTTTFYNQFFGTNHFQGFNYYGDHYGTNNDNHYDLFSAGGMDFVVVYFEYDANMTIASPVIAWANSVLQTYSNRRAIVVSHWIINSGFNATFSAQGQTIYDGLKGNTNLFLMLCGHVSPPEGQRTDTYQGRAVWSVLSDYQGRTGGGSGWLRLYEFSPSNNVIHVKTYSPWLDQSETDSDSQFDIPYNMSSASPFTAIATNVGVASGNISSVIWAGLLNNTAYDWYVTVNDGTTTTTGPVWQFTTGNAFNTPPTVSTIANQVVSEDTSTGPISFTVGDGETAAGSLTLSKGSSNPTLIPTNNIVFGGSGANRTVTVTPAANQSGSSTITVSVSDGQASVSTNFTVTVNAVNDAPTITSIGNQTISVNGTTGPLNFTIVDAETAAGSLTLGKASSNTTLVPTNNIVFGGSGGSRTVTVTPAAGQSGSATITVSVSDGVLSASNSFVLNVIVQPVGLRSFTNSASITIPTTAGNATPYPSQIVVSNMNGTITNVTVTLRSMSHTWPADVDVLLVGPGGQKSMIMSDVGSGNQINNVTLTFADSAAFTIGAFDQIVSGTNKPSDVEPGEQGELDAFSSPAPGGPYTALLSVFNGQAPNGTWSLYVTDDGNGDGGSIASGWSLTIGTLITNTAPVATSQNLTNAEDAQLAITLTGSDPEGSNLIYTVTSNPIHGTLSGVAPNLTYKPVTNYSGLDSLNFRVSDGVLTSAVATVSITITPVNDAPIASNTTVQVNGDVATGIAMSANDPETNAMTFALGTLPTHGLLSGFNSANGTVTYTPAHGFAGGDSLTFTAGDGSATSPAATLSITVLPRTDLDGDNMPDAWETAYGVSNPNADTDGDGMVNWKEYAANTNPTNALSVLSVISTTRLSNGNCVLVWKSVGGTRYRVGYCDGATGGAINGAFSPIVRPISQELDAAPIGTDSTQSFTDDYSLTGGPPANRARYYRIEVVE